MSFDQFLQKKILITTSKKELLIKLQLEHEEFHGLNSMTLTNWIKGRSIPSLHKQLLIAQSYCCFYDYFEYFEGSKVSKEDERFFSSIIDKIDSPYHQILPSSANTFFSYQKGKHSELYSYIKPFASKVGNFSTIFEQLRHTEANAELLAIKSEDNKKLESFIWISHGFDAYLDYMSHSVKKHAFSEKDCLAITLVYYRYSEHFLLLIGILFNLLLEQYSFKRKLVLSSRGFEGLMISEHLGGKLISSFPGLKCGNYYLHEFDTIRFLSNPIIINIAKQYSKKYHNDFKYTPSLLSEQIVHPKNVHN